MVRKLVLFSLLGCLFACNISARRTAGEYKDYDNLGLSRSDYFDVLDAPKDIKDKKLTSLEKTKLIKIPKKPVLILVFF